MNVSWLTAARRRWLYSITTAAVPLLVAYDVVAADLAPFWLTLAAAALGTLSPVVALGHITPDQRTGPAPIEPPPAA